MHQHEIIRQAQRGRPELAAINAGCAGRPRLAAFVARYPHSSGHVFPVRELVASALHAVPARLRHRGAVLMLRADREAGRAGGLAPLHLPVPHVHAQGPATHREVQGRPGRTHLTRETPCL